MNRLVRGDMRGVGKKGVRIVLRRGPVSETGGMAEIGQTGCDGRESFHHKSPTVLSVPDCPFTPPYQQVTPSHVSASLC